MKNRDVEVARLNALARNDATVKAFLNHWEIGGFGSFSDMLMELVVTLSSEKEEYLQKAVRYASLSPPPAAIIERENKGE